MSTSEPNPSSTPSESPMAQIDTLNLHDEHDTKQQSTDDDVQQQQKQQPQQSSTTMTFEDETHVSNTETESGEKRGMKRQRHYNDNDPGYDRFGHKATNQLFFDRLPETIKESDLQPLFISHNVTEIHLGNKTLKRGEFRTAVVKFATVQDAINCRTQLQHYQDKDWENPILINFVKTNATDGPGNISPHQYHMKNYYHPSQSPSHFRQQQQQQQPPPQPYVNYDNYYPNYYSPGPQYHRPGRHHNNYYPSRTYSQPGRRFSPHNQYGGSPGPYYNGGYNNGDQFYPSNAPLPPHSRAPKNRTHQNHPLLPATQQLASPSVLDQDKLGNTACPCLFVKNFSRHVTEGCIRNAFPSVQHIVLGTKTLQPGEYRTAYLYFEDVVTAVQERNRLNGKTIPLLNYTPLLKSAPPKQQTTTTTTSSATTPTTALSSSATSSSATTSTDEKPKEKEDVDAQDPLSIYYSKRPQDQTPHSNSNVLNYFFDSRGNPATNCLFIDQLPYDITEQQIHRIFDKYSPVNIVVGNKQLNSNEFRTALIYFATVQQAVNCRSELQK